MRRVVSELCRSLKEILLVGVLLLVLIFVFASYGVHLFGMYFAACNDQTKINGTHLTREQCHGTFRYNLICDKMVILYYQPLPNIINCTRIYIINLYNSRAEVFVTKMNLEEPTDGCQNPWLLVPRVWINPRRFHFDHIGMAMLSLFEVLSFKGNYSCVIL